MTARAAARCPCCGTAGRPVGAVTLDKQLKPAARAAFQETARFCPSPDCGLVYFDGAHRAARSDLRSARAHKDPASPWALFCPCFGITRADIFWDVSTRGRTDVASRVRMALRDKGGDCERLNPSGDCCLKDLPDEVRRARQGILAKNPKTAR